MTDQREDIYCTLVLNDGYLPGAAVLAHSLRDAGSTKKLACMIVQDNLRASTIEELQSLYNYVIPIERIGTPKPANLYLMNRPDLLYTFTKINLWRLTQFRKIVYIDADVVALRAPEELFDLPDAFAAAPDVGWPDAFNSGVMVLTPNAGDFAALRTLASAGDSFDGADQGLLNQYYEHKPWKRLSFTYNTTPSANYQYEPAYRYYKRDISLVHFIGSNKPWQRGRDTHGTSSAFQETLARWWAVWDRHHQVSTHDYIEGRRHPPPQQQQRHHQQQSSDNYYATGYPASTTQPAPPPTTGAPSNEIPMTEPGEHAENIAQGIVQPTPTSEQRRFSAPQMEWDATRGAPPVESRPEAATFPTQTYEFNTDPAPFRPPPSYPEPPRDMWYEVPKEKPRPQEKPPPIFPWEEREVPKPTRRFFDDEQPEPEPEVSQGMLDELEVQSDDSDRTVVPEIKVNDQNPWQAFATTRNAWDDVSGIDRYVRALSSYQNKRSAPTSPYATKPSANASSENVPAASKNTDTTATAKVLPADDIVAQVQARRESLILTDFPTAIERPSLPVTPAPRRRTFWGKNDAEDEEEKEKAAALPEAEGVPHQSEWVCPRCGFLASASSSASPSFVSSSPSTALSTVQASPARHKPPPPSPSSSVSNRKSVGVASGPQSYVTKAALHRVSSGESSETISGSGADPPDDGPGNVAQGSTLFASTPGSEQTAQATSSLPAEWERAWKLPSRITIAADPPPAWTMDPTRQLETLRRNSLLTAAELQLLTGEQQRTIPDRQMPSTAGAVQHAQPASPQPQAPQHQQPKAPSPELVTPRPVNPDMGKKLEQIAQLSGGSSPHGLLDESSPFLPADPISTTTEKKTVLETKVNTALNTAANTPVVNVAGSFKDVDFNPTPRRTSDPDFSKVGEVILPKHEVLSPTAVPKTTTKVDELDG